MKTNLRICPDCDGHGYISGGDERSSWSRTCFRCQGTGYIQVPLTIADRIRVMTDEELAAFWSDNYDNFCPSKPECGALLDTDQCIPGEWCAACALEWLRQPYEKTRLPKGMYLDKQESGLIEED